MEDKNYDEQMIEESLVDESQSQTNNKPKWENGNIWFDSRRILLLDVLILFIPLSFSEVNVFWQFQAILS